MSLRSQLIRDEGSRTTAYHDSKGNCTFGVGHKGSTPLSVTVISLILNDDIATATTDLMHELPLVAGLSPTRFNALINMTFTMGIGGVMEFKEMIDALRLDNYKAAADAIRASQWAKVEAPQRAERIAKQMETDIEQ